MLVLMLSADTMNRYNFFSLGHISYRIYYARLLEL